ncbi:MAG TPA: aldehyde dehydrogenase family protein [Geodermatophilus sp.]|nr:aldehyde dehydrogenase family protein [Geodermatophilus sp.]
MPHLATAELITHTGVHVGGRWVPSASAERIDVLDPRTGAVLARVPAGSSADVDRAVRAARDAFPAWAASPVAERAGFLTAIAARLTERADELAAVVSRELGSPLSTSRRVHVDPAVGVFRSCADLAPRLDPWKPVGVVAAVAPSDHPLHHLARPLAAALAAGCTLVLAPSARTPLSAYRLVELLDAVRLPPGVVNLVVGEAATVGGALATHPGVDLVCTPGSGQPGVADLQEFLGTTAVQR